MPDREEQIARTEATAREINESIERAHGEPSGHQVRMVCECGDASCEEVLAITTEEYEEVRRNPRWFVVRHGHAVADVERVVRETDRYMIVQKRGGTPSAVAEERDPRS